MFFNVWEMNEFYPLPLFSYQGYKHFCEKEFLYYITCHHSLCMKMFVKSNDTLEFIVTLGFLFSLPVYDYLCQGMKGFFAPLMTNRFIFHVPFSPALYSPLSKNLHPSPAPLPPSQLSLMRSPYETIKNRCYCCIITKLANKINWRRDGGILAPVT